MKRILIVLFLLMVLPLAVVLAADAKSEIALSGSFLKAGGGTSYFIQAEVLAPVGGHLLAGPSVALHSDGDLTTAGAVVEFDLAGQKGSGGPTIGASYVCLLSAPDAGERCSGSARAALKFKVAESVAVKVFAERPVHGRGKEAGDTSAQMALILRF